MIILYVLESCPYCNHALEVLDQNKIKYKKIIVENEIMKNEIKKKNKMNTFPQIFVSLENDHYLKIGGSSDLDELIQKCKEFKNNNISIYTFFALYQNMNSK